MANGDWIVYEHSTRWAAAFRTHSRRELATQFCPRIFEARRFSDVASRLRTHRSSLVLLEVNLANLANLLDWLADIVPRYPRACFAALVDRNLTGSSRDRLNTIDWLLEAGAREVALSPRQLSSIFALAHRHAESVPVDATPSSDLAIRDWAWNRLPWQGDERRIG